MTDKPDLIVGDSGDGKTSLLGTAAIWLYKKTGKPSRLVSADPGGWGPLDPLVAMGIVEVIDVGAILAEHAHTFEVLTRVCKGFHWTGKGWEKGDLTRLAGLFVEGLTSFSEVELLAIAEKAADAKGENFGPDAAVRFQDGALRIGSNGLAHYNVVQNEMLKLVSYTAQFPGKVIWTARETKETDEGQGQLVFGPELAGRKKTAAAPAWFGHCLGIEIRQVKGGEPRRVLHTQKWFDPGAQGRPIPHLAKTRSTPLELFIRDRAVKGITIPPECVVPAECDASLETFYELYDAAVAKSAEVLRSYLGKT